MRISDWSSDVCSSDLTDARVDVLAPAEPVELRGVAQVVETRQAVVERRLGRHDPAAGPHVAAVHRRVETEHPDLTGVWGEGAGDHADGRRLAGAEIGRAHV